MTSRRIALFDLDGTLTDPAVGIVASVRAGLTAVDIDPDSAGDLTRFIGPPLQDSFAAMGLDEAGVERAVAGFRERFGAGGMFENEVYDGVPKLLDDLAADGWTLAIATSKPEKFATMILRRFELDTHLAVIAGATMDGARRTKVDVIAHALELLAENGLGGVSGEPTVMIGDRDTDITGAKTHGLATIGVVYGYGSPEELIAVDPDALAAEPKDLLALIPAVTTQT